MAKDWTGSPFENVVCTAVTDGLGNVTVNQAATAQRVLDALDAEGLLLTAERLDEIAKTIEAVSDVVAQAAVDAMARHQYENALSTAASIVRQAAQR